MADNISTNRLSIYLIKDEIANDAEIIENIDIVNKEIIDSNTTLYYSKSGQHTPKWVKSFLVETDSDSIKSSLYSSYVSAVLVVTIKIDGVNKTFAITFGLGGWHMLVAGCYEERFGLMCTLNLVSPDSLRSIEKNSLGLAPKQSQEQVSQEGVIADFGIDIEQDLVRSVSGKCKDANLGTAITGKSSLHVSTKADIRNIKSILVKYFNAYKSTEYKKNFGWIDYVAEVKDQVIVSELCDMLDVQLQDHSSEKIWLAIPDVINWSDLEGFYYQGSRSTLFNDLFINDARSVYNDQEIEFSVENLKNRKVYAKSTSGNHDLQSWRLLNCLYAEIHNENTNSMYILSNGKWYNIEENFVAQINKSFQESLTEASDSMYYRIGESERIFNERVADEGKIICLDGRIVQHGGGQSKIEFCDLLDIDKKILYHIKKYGNSSVLSHLFNQGLVSGELMLSDIDFRTKVNNLNSDELIFEKVGEKPRASEYTVVYGIISGVSKPLEIPFFSKVSLRNAKRRLELIGYKVIVQKIEHANETN